VLGGHRFGLSSNCCFLALFYAFGQKLSRHIANSFRTVYNERMEKVFYGAEVYGYTRAKLVALAKSRGIAPEHVWIDGRTDIESFEELLGYGPREGDVLEVPSLLMFAKPKSKRSKTPPRDVLEQRVIQVLGIGADVYEIESGLTLTTPAAVAQAVFNAVNRLAAGGRTAKRPAHRPRWQKPEPALCNAAKAVWLDTKIGTNAAALAELKARPDLYGGPWSRGRVFAEFGGSGRAEGKGGRPRKPREQ
jgi:hypothetical protein